MFAIESTNHCNLRCVMCPRGEPDIMERSLGTMSDGLFQKILDDAKFFTDPCWFHWFGEPLMHPRLFEQIALAKSRGVPNLGISTNGTLLDAARSRAILDSPLDTLMIAVDGTSKEVYERIGISSTFTFEQVVENVRGSGPPSPPSRSGMSASGAMPRLMGMRSADMRRSEMPPPTAATHATNRPPTTPPGLRGRNSWRGWGRSFLLRARGVVATSGSSRSLPISTAHVCTTHQLSPTSRFWKTLEAEYMQSCQQY